MATNLSILSSINGIDDNVKAMVLSLPDFSIGDKVHSIFVNRLKGATPGRHTEAFGSGQKYVDIFFPGYKPVNYIADFSRLTQLDDGWWSNFAVVVLCQSMDVLTHDLHPQMQHEKINSTIANYNTTLCSRTMPFYSCILSNTFTEFKIPFNQVDNSAAKEEYKKVLLAGVNIHDLWYAEGLWKNPSWEMFHHYVKLYALGASVIEINQLIDSLRAAGLVIPSEMDKDKWVSYREYFHNKYDIDHNDIDQDARGGILKSVYIPSIGGNGSDMKEENSFEFTSNGQPGSVYRSTGGSCFQKGALVLMQDLTLKPIEEIKAGDFVASSSGPKEVAFLSKPFRCNRTLYSVNSLPLKFTASHPFINERGLNSDLIPKIVSMDPYELKSWIPTLSRVGIEKMEEGSDLTGIKLYGENPINLEVVIIRTIEKYNAEKEDKYEILYDVILKQDSSGDSQYIVGSKEQLFLVSSEVPYASMSPFASMVILEALDDFLPSIKDDLFIDDKEESIDMFFEKLQDIRRKISSELLYKAASKVQFEENITEIKLQDINEYVSKHMEMFMTEKNEFHWVIGNIFEMVTSQMSGELDSAIELGFRNFNEDMGEVHSLSITELDFDNISVDKNTLLKLNITISTEKGEKKYTIEDSQGRLNTNFVHFFDKVLYVEENRKWIERISFEVIESNSGKLILSGGSNLPKKLSASYRRFYTVLQSIEGEDWGKIFFDIRLMKKEMVNKEKSRAMKWNEDSKMIFAKALAKEVGTTLREIWES
jgi:hypothetical protein